MNSKSFFQALRQVIREEVSTVVREELHNVLTENHEPKPSKPKVKQGTQVPAVRTARAQKTYSNNPMLNEILNSVGGFKSTNSSNPYSILDESIDFESMHNDYNEWPTMSNKHMSRAVPAVLKDVNGSTISAEQLSQTEAGAAVLDAVTKDYSALMKAIDKKKGL